MSDTTIDHARRVARLGLGRTLQAATVPARALARAAMRHRPDLEPHLAGRTWLWQPGWGRGAHERLHRCAGPYGADAGDYERAANDLVIRALAGSRPDRVLEVGCGGGLLSDRLVMLTDELVGVDVSDAAIARARARLDGDDRARFERRTLPFDMPEGTFDLIVCCDVLYYWDAATLRVGLDRLLARLRPGGRLLALHHLGDFGQAGSGDAVHDLTIELGRTRAGLIHLAGCSVDGVGPGGTGLRLDVLAIVGSPDIADALPGIPEQRGPGAQREPGELAQLPR